MHVCRYILTHLYYILTHLYVYTYLCIHKYIYTHIHIYIKVLFWMIPVMIVASLSNLVHI